MTQCSITEGNFKEIDDQLEKFHRFIQEKNSKTKISLILTGEVLIEALKPELSKKLVSLAT